MCLNNINIYFDFCIMQVIEKVDFIIKIFSFYLSDYNLIELLFNIFKT